MKSIVGMHLKVYGKATKAFLFFNVQCQTSFIKMIVCEMIVWKMCSVQNYHNYGMCL